MLQIADVLKLKCKFVREWVKYLNNRKYTVNYCYSDIYKYFSDYKLATTLADCLEYEDECELTSKANLLPDEPDDMTIDIDCEAQLQLSLSYTIKPCTYTPSALIDSQARLKFNIKPNSILHDRTINLLVTSSCDPNNPVVEEVFLDSITYYETGFAIAGAKFMTNGYLSNIRVYKTDATGSLIDFPIDIDVSITTPYLVGTFGTASALDLYFTSSNYTTALNTVLKNAIDTLYGSVTYIEPDIRFDGSGNLYVYTKAKHNPNSHWVGVNTLPGKHSFTYYDGTKFKTVANIISSTTNSMALNYNWTYDTPCSTGNAVTLHSNGQLMYIPATINFNSIIPSSVYSTNPVYITGNSAVCNQYVLLATTTTTEDILSKGWSFGEFSFGAADKIIVSELGDYTYDVVLDTGCSYTETLTIP